MIVVYFSLVSYYIHLTLLTSELMAYWFGCVTCLPVIAVISNFVQKPCGDYSVVDVQMYIRCHVHKCSYLRKSEKKTEK